MRMRKLFLFMLTMLFSVSAYADYGDIIEVDGIKYFVEQDPWEESPGRVYVTSNEAGYTGSITIPATIIYTKTYEVIGIQSQAFKECTGLTSVTIKNGLTNIGSEAFKDCTDLISVTIPSSVTYMSSSVFFGCTKLTDVTLNAQMENIEWGTFQNCTSLESITIPNSVTRIGDSAFRGCSKLANVTLSDKLKTLEWGAFWECTSLKSISLPSNVTKMGNDYDDGYVFYGCTSLESIIIPSGVKKIQSNSFYGCTSLTTITFLGDVTTIGSSAFWGCTSLASIEIPNTVTKIDNNAFNGCTSLTSINIPTGVKKIDDNTFNGCTSLLSIEIPSSVETIGCGVFSNCTSLTSIVIPNSVTSIDREAFQNCSKLTSITLSDQLTSIASWMFGQCTSLTSVDIPNGVTSIGDYAFNGCSKLSSITIPSSVNEINNWAFQSCNGLRIVTSEIATPFEVENAFDWSSYEAALVVPVGKRAAYKSVNGWKEFAAIFEQGETVCASKQTDDQGIVYKLVQTDDYSTYYSVSERTEALKAEIVIPAELDGCPVKTIEQMVFNGTNITSITIPNSVTSISRDAFSGCSKLISVTLSDQLTTIDNYVFSGCSSLSSITIPSSVTTIGESAFNGCSSLKAITIPKNVTAIGNYAFGNCDNVKVVTSEILEPFEVDAFNWWYYNAALVVPEGKRADYRKVNGWNQFAYTIEEGEPLYDVPMEQTDEQGLTYRLKQADDNSVYYSVTGHAEEMKADIVIPAELDGCPVGAIEDWALQNCTKMTSITFHGNVKVGYNTFYGCAGLKDVNVYVWDAAEFCNNQILGGFDNPISYWDDVKKESITNYFTIHLYDTEENEIRDYEIPEGVTSIGDGAFKGYASLSSVTIPKSVTSIGVNAFRNCDNLVSVKMGKNVSSIGDYAFYNCYSLQSIQLPKKLESIGSYAFSGDDNWIWSDGYKYLPFTSITIPGSVKTIGNGAFYGCRELEQVTFGTVEDEEEGGLISIGDNAFQCCALTSITLPNSVKTIGSGAFTYNIKLATASLGDALTEIGEGAFSNCGVLSSVTIPDGVTSIGARAFQYCSLLTSVIIPRSLTSIGEDVFENCPLKSIDLPDGITAIPANLFKNNDFEYIKLGKNVKSIGKNAFGCKLEGDETIVVMEIGASTPPAIANDAFPKELALSVINVIVPDLKAETSYKNVAVWKEMTYANLDNNVEVTMTAEMAGDLGNEVLDQCNIAAAKVVGLKVKGIINADDFVQMKSNMKSLLRLDLSECDITAIPDGAMQGKTQLQELALPTTLQTIGNSAFQGCPYLTGKLDLPAGVTSIGNYAFEGTYYTSVNLPRSLKSIGDYAFYNLPIKQKLMIPEGMTSIGAYAFADTYIFGHVEIPDGVEKLGDGAFRNTQITSVFLPTGITSLNWSVFQGCSNLDEALYIPDNVTSMYGYAFDGCSSLTNIRLSANMTAMGEYAFQNTNVEYIRVPSKVKVLSQGVFKNSKNLESLALPAYLKTVGAEALYGCSGLRNLSIEALEPPTAEKSSFVGVNTDLCLISLPTESYRAYRRAEFWGLFVQMRNDIAVQTEGNGEIAFEAVVEGEEEESLSRARARVRSYMSARAATRGSGETNEPELTYANNGSSVYIPKNAQVNFLIIPGEGEMLVSAFLDGEDITAAVKDGVYTATADKASANLVVKFSGEAQEEVETEFIKITSAKQVPYCSSFDLDFTDMPDLKAYVATGYDKTKGTIWLTRVKQVPAETGFLLVGEAGDYNIPISLSAANTYYKNMFKGTIEGTTIYTDEWMSDGHYTNYYLSKGSQGVGFYKVTNPNGQNISANRCYLPIPDIWDDGYVGGSETITVSSAKQLPYFTGQSIDFTNVPGLKAYTATGYNYTTGVIWLTRVMKVPSQTGILIIADEAGEYSIPTDQIASVYKNMFTGSLYEQTIYTTEEKDGIEYINYYLSNGASGLGYYKVTNANGVNMKANRSYLQIPNRDTAAGARSMNGNASFSKMVISDNDDDVIAIPLLGGMIGDDEETTGIRNAQFEEAEPDAYYTLQGQRVENPRKGVYIKNGKKVVVK